MRKFLMLGLVFIMLFSFVGCEKKLPEGVENEEFYNDMIHLANIISKDYKNNTLTYEFNSNKDEFVQKLFNYNDNDLLNEKEKEILDTGLAVIKIYNDYYKNQSEIYEAIFKKAVKQFLDLMELDYKIESEIKF